MPKLFHLLMRRLRHIRAVKNYRSSCHFCKPQNRAHQRRLAAAGLSYQTDYFTFINMKGNIIHRFDGAICCMKIFFQIFDFNCYFWHVGTSSQKHRNECVSLMR